MLVAGTGEPTLLSFPQTRSSVFHPLSFHCRSYQFYNCGRNSNPEDEQESGPMKATPRPLPTVIHHGRYFQVRCSPPPAPILEDEKICLYDFQSLIQSPLIKLTALQMVNPVSVTECLTEATSGKEGLLWLSVDEHSPLWQKIMMAGSYITSASQAGPSPLVLSILTLRHKPMKLCYPHLGQVF